MTQQLSMSGADAQKQSGRAWETLKVLVPSVVTALVGFLIWNAQMEMQSTVDNSNRILQMQLALKEEYYKRRLTIYENACKQIAETKTALDQAAATPSYETQAQDRMAELDKLRRTNMLYWSPNLDKQLGNLWWLGVNKLKTKQFEDDKLEETLDKEIADLHTQMKQDLDLGEIAKVHQDAR